MKHSDGQGGRLYRFGPFCLDTQERVLLRDGKLVSLPAKVLSTLLTLVLNRGHLVEKDVLMSDVWPDEFVEEGNLAQHVSMLRKALGETTESPKYIETVPRRGYRFIARVEEPRIPEHESVIDSLAILPFSSGSNDPSMDYLFDGITESVINSLSHLPQLRVMARSTVFRYCGVDVVPQHLGQALGVRAVMLGKVQQLGKHLIISAELVDTSDGSRIWGDQYRKDSSDILCLQEELASEIAGKLRLRLSRQQKERVTKRFTESTHAYECYLRGRYSWSKRTDEELKKGVEYFREAIADDPKYALAYAGLADCLLLLGLFGAEAPRLVMPRAKEAALKAIQLDETLGEAYASLAQIRFIYDLDWQGAEWDFQEATRLSPTYPTAYQWHAEYLYSLGRIDEGLVELKRARDLDPLSLVINTSVGLALYFAHRYDEAIEHLRRIIDLEPGFFKAHLVLGMVYERKSMFPEAIAELTKARQVNENSWTVGGLGYALASSGKQAEAEQLLRWLSKLSRSRYVSATTFAMIHAGFRNHVHETLDWLEKAYEERAGVLVWLGGWPIFDHLRPEERFADLLRRIRLGFSQKCEVWTTHDKLPPEKVVALGSSLNSSGACSVQLTERTIENSPSSAAHRSYLKGRYYWSKFNNPALQKAIDCFQQAIYLDPTYALAYVGMADSYTRLATAHYSPAEVVPKARAALFRALQINENLAEAHATLGKLKMDHEWDWAGAEKEFKRAIELKPEYATTHLWYGAYLDCIGELEAALVHKQRALELDPLSLWVNVSIAGTLWLMKRYDESLLRIHETLEMDESFLPAQLLLAFVNEQNNNHSGSVNTLTNARDIDDSPFVLAHLGRAYAVAGKREKAETIIQDLQAQAERRYVPPYSVALLMSGLGDVDRSFQWLERACGNHDEWLFLIKVDPRLEQLRPDPRFKKLVKRIFGRRLAAPNGHH